MTTPRLLNGGLDNPNVEGVYDGSIAVSVYDLMYFDTNDFKPASSQADAGTEAANQATFAPLFAGVAADGKLSDAAAGTIKILTDVVGEYDCPSDTWEVGDLVTIDEATSGTALSDIQVVKTTDETLAIGRCVKREASAVTRVRVRLISRVFPHHSHVDSSLTLTTLDFNGAADALILDADGDTTISAPTDDQIDIEISGADDFTFTANTFSVLTGSGIDLADSCQIVFGTGDDVTVSFDGTNLVVATAVADTGAVALGADDLGVDLILYGATTLKNVTWDQSADSLIFTDSTPAVFGTGSDASIQFDGTQLVISPIAAGGVIHIGDAADTAANAVHVFDGGTDKPGMIVLYDHVGAPHYLWVDNTGDLRVHTAAPADEDADGTIVGTQA